MTQVVGEVNRQKICRVCSDRAMGFNFNAITCESCKAFFRRNAFKTEKLRCPFNNDCIIDKSTRRFCQKCRLEKCLQVGMKREWILSEEQKKIKRAKIAENRLKRKSDGNDEPTDEKSRKSNDKTRDSTVVDHPTSSSFSPSCSSSSSSQYGDDNNSTCAYKFSADNSNPSIFTTSLTRQEGSSVYDFSLDSLLASKPNQLNPSSSFKETSSIFGTNDTPIDLGPPERYNHLKPLTTTTHSVDRDSLDANWVSLITDPSTSQSIRKSCFISHILDSNKANCYNHHDGNSENMEDTANSNLHLCSSPASVLLSLTSPDNVRLQLEPINNKSNNNQELDEREESWRLKVNHRILEANFMPIYLRNTQEDCSSLNELETLKINELVQSFSAIDEPILDHSCVEGSGISDVIKFSDLAIRRLIKWCKKIHAFSSLCLEDQMALLKAGCLEMLSMKASFNFNVDDESWQDAYTKNGVKLTVFRQASEKLYQAHRQFIKTFNQRWRTDHKVNLLLVAIVLFNPDRPNLLHPATVRLEHYTYIYLLRRYLETKSDSLCQARSDHYHLMMKIEDLRELHEKTLRLYSDAGPEVVGPLLIEILDLK